MYEIHRIRSIAAVYGLFSSMCALLTTLLAIAVLLVISLIPLYINEGSSQALGEREYRSTLMNDTVLYLILSLF
jgi:hypothetical protein